MPGEKGAILATLKDLSRHLGLNAEQLAVLRAADPGMVEAFMRQYDLSSEEGVLLMCVAEALLRIPDRATADKLIRDKLGDADWDRHMGQSSSVLVNASTWGLMLTGRMVNLADETRRVPGRAAGEPRPLEQDDVAPAELGEVIGQAAAGDPAADNRADHRGRTGVAFQEIEHLAQEHRHDLWDHPKAHALRPVCAC